MGSENQPGGAPRIGLRFRRKRCQRRHRVRREQPPPRLAPDRGGLGWGQPTPAETSVIWNRPTTLFLACGEGRHSLGRTCGTLSGGRGLREVAEDLAGNFAPDAVKAADLREHRIAMDPFGGATDKARSV